MSALRRTTGLSRGQIRDAVLALVRDESGQDLIEYALVAALIGLGVVISMKGLATRIGSAFTTIGATLASDV